MLEDFKIIAFVGICIKNFGIILRPEDKGFFVSASYILSCPDSKNFRLSFETPHHQRAAESNEYKKDRKERVLDVLRLGYLFGWKEERIREYMASKDIVSFYNLPAFLVHILWERGVER